MATQGWTRAWDQDRAHVVEVLCDAYAAGCLDRSELDERTGRAYCARTLAEPYGLTVDLPAGLFDRPVPLPRENRDRARPPRLTLNRPRES